MDEKQHSEALETIRIVGFATVISLADQLYPHIIALWVLILMGPAWKAELNERLRLPKGWRWNNRRPAKGDSFEASGPDRSGRVIHMLSAQVDSDSWLFRQRLRFIAQVRDGIAQRADPKPAR